MNKFILHIILFVFTSSFLQAQISVDNENEDFLNNISEKVNLFTDRDLYLSGENVWFTAFVLINDSFNENDLSKIIYLELVDGKKKTIFQGKYKINKGITTGSFQIPEETISGSYFIRSYTLYQRNFSPENIQTKQITIVNPEFPWPQENQPGITLTNDTSEMKVSNQDGLENIKIHIKADKAVYEKRDPIVVKMNMPGSSEDEVGRLCVSVVRRGTLQQPNEISTSTLGENNFGQNKLHKVFWIPETRGVSISGIISDRNTAKPLSGLKVYLSVLGENSQLHIARTKENGAFVFSLGFIAGINELFLGVDPLDHSNVHISVNNNFSSDFSLLPYVPILIDTGYKSLLEEMLVNYQTQQIFSPQMVETSDAPEKRYEVFSHPEVSIRLADFIDLPDLESVFYELIPTVKVKEKEGEKKISVFDPHTDITFPNKLLLLDHVPVFDNDAVLGIPPFRIDNIEVVNSTYYLGDNTFRNVVMINSKSHDFAGYNFPAGSIFVDYQTLSPKKEFGAPVYENLLDKNSRIPDFRTLLYWNPELMVSIENKTLHFYASDNAGVYDIFVRGFTKNGKPCFGQGSFKIH